MSQDETKNKRVSSSLWQKAVVRYQEELQENDDYQVIMELGSLDDLMNQAKSIEPLLPPERRSLSSMNRVGPKLKFVDDFTALIALYFGADAKLIALVWGSIRLMLTLASSAGDTLQNILDMLEELSLTLPRFRAYEAVLPMNRALEAALVDVYTEVICFYARTIHFFRTHPHVLLRRGAWEEFHRDFARTVQRIKRMSSTVEKEADLARMKTDEARYKEVLDIMEGIKHSKTRDEENRQCYFIPLGLNPRFWGRDQALKAIEEALRKTQIALQFANKNREMYDTILWAAADTTIRMGQSFRDIAQHLGVVKSEEEKQDSVAAILKAKAWLRETPKSQSLTESHSSWLLIFDNADDLEILRQAWPGDSNGAVLITTRNVDPARNPAPASFHVQPFDDDTGSEMLLNLVGLDANVASNQEKAKAITNTLGGLPLALSQIGGFISQRKLPLQDFIPIYERNAAKIDSKRTGITDYDHTLSTVWEISLTKLSGDSLKLLNMLAFFEPDSISEVVFTESAKVLRDRDFEFLTDELDLGDAEEVLLRAALINKSIEDAVLSVHRLVQASVLRRLGENDRIKYFDTAVQMLNWGFPDTWSQDIGHQFQAWTKCDKCLPHVNHLTKQASRYKISPRNPQVYGELLLRCSWYVGNSPSHNCNLLSNRNRHLYERESYDIARTFVDVALEVFPDKSSLAFASAVDLSGLLDLDMNYPVKALEPFNIALGIREKLLGPDDPLIASSLNNIALAYTEAGNLEKAFANHEKAIGIRLRTKSDRIGNSYSNMSSLLLRMDKPDEAEEMLKRCPSLKDFTDDTFLKTGNPRFSGDMVLLSRIRSRQGLLDDALRLASKALTFRQTLLGNRLKTSDSLYDVAGFLCQLGKDASALELLLQLVAISESLNEGEGQLARANFKLSLIYKDNGMDLESRSCKVKAVELRAKLGPEAKDAAFEEPEFMKLCPWMLW
ncbi:hypothetical protein BJ878DRAFT_532187 [Calycina marina]|uniref:Uncharacterized protein n=1 Tax=Calycina marina TaxID=1763456 RepID=A0A9P7ZAU8_9HELO|nr:hypothetical protein BJ878DRAFT_532187 [Calycina marina]